jgi:hypothetical protein
MVIAPSGKNILNLTNGFNQFFEAGQAFRGESARCETEQSMPLVTFTSRLSNFHLRRR